MEEPVLVYDDDCGFCTWWAEFFAEESTIPIVGYSELTPDLRERLPEDYESCSHLVTAERVYSCGSSIEEAFVRSDVGEPARPVVDLLRDVEAYNSAREWGYRWVAENRSDLSELLTVIDGDS